MQVSAFILFFLVSFSDLMFARHFQTVASFDTYPPSVIFPLPRSSPVWGRNDARSTPFQDPECSPFFPGL